MITNQIKLTMVILDMGCTQYVFQDFDFKEKMTIKMKTSFILEIGICMCDRTSPKKC